MKVILPESALSSSNIAETCPNNHALPQITLKVLQQVNPRYCSGFYCDICHADYKDVSVPMYHCFACDYDVCMNCHSAGISAKGAPTIHADRYPAQIGSWSSPSVTR
jgi:hypothetical protein